MNTNFKDKCFKCGGKVKKGYIQYANRIAWVPKVSVEPTLNTESVLLSKQTRLSINHIDAYICENVKMFL